MTQEKYDLQKFFIEKNVSDEANDLLYDFLMNPFKTDVTSHLFYVNVEFSWMLEDIVKKLPLIVKQGGLDQSHADEITKVFETFGDAELTKTHEIMPEWWVR
jgi:hypothetical protein